MTDVTPDHRFVVMKLLRNPILTALLVLCASALLAPSAFAAKTGTLAVSLEDAPKKSKKAKRSFDVRAIQVGTSLVVAATRVKSTSAKLKLAPGAYLVSVRATSIPGKTVEGTSGIVAVKAGKTVKQKVKARALNAKYKKKKRAKKPKKKRTNLAYAGVTIPDEYFAPASETAGQIIAGIDPDIKVYGFSEYPKGLEIDGVLTTAISKGCPSDNPKFRLVEIRRRAELKDEIDLGQTEYVDKSTAVKKGHWVRERQMVRGGGTVTNGRITVRLTIEDIATGQILAAGAAEGREVDFIEVMDAASEELMRGVCAGKVDVTFTGSGNYQRDEGNGGTDIEQHVTANTGWSITYKNVPLSGNGEIIFGSASQISGNWTTNGRFGAVGPGNFTCSAPLAGYAGDFAMAKTVRTGANVRLTLTPYFNVQGDHTQTSCSGLGSPPYASFLSTGLADANLAIVDFAIDDLAAAGKLIFNVGPTTALPADCSDLLSGYETPCTQSSSWSGQVTVTKAAL